MSELSDRQEKSDPDKLLAQKAIDSMVVKGDSRETITKKIIVLYDYARKSVKSWRKSMIDASPEESARWRMALGHERYVRTLYGEDVQKFKESGDSKRPARDPRLRARESTSGAQAPRGPSTDDNDSCNDGDDNARSGDSPSVKIAKTSK